MSQITAYKCDQCEKTIGEKKHISLNFGGSSGVAVPPRYGNRSSVSWSFAKNLAGQFLHFCGAKCTSTYFTELYDSAK